VASAGDMLILSAGHAHFSRQRVGIWGICPGFGVWGGHVPCDPGLPGPAAGHAQSFRCVPGQPKGHAHGFRSSRLARADMPILSGTCLPFRGTCPFIVPLGGLVASAGDMLILSAGHAHFSRLRMGIWGICPGFGVWGGHVPCNPGLPGPAAGHARSFWSAAGQPGDMLIRSQAPRSHPGGHVHSSRQGPDIWGICPGLGVSGGHVQRAGGDPPSQIKPARGHCVLPTAEDGTQ